VISYELLLAFDSNDPEFTRGFEAGRLWERIRSDDSAFEETLHASNAEMVMRMCEARDREFSARSIDDTWIEVAIT
jgi:hypothetical protein